MISINSFINGTLRTIINKYIMILYIQLFLISFLISSLFFMIIRSAFIKKFFLKEKLNTSTLTKGSGFEFIPFLEIKIFIITFIFFFFMISYLDTNIIFCSDKETLNLSENTLSSHINVNNPNINIKNLPIPNTVVQGLTNMGLGASMASGASAATAIVKKSSLPLGAKAGAGVAGGILSGASFVGMSAANSVVQNKINRTSESVSSLKVEVEPSSKVSFLVVDPDVKTSTSSVSSHFKIHSSLEPNEIPDPFTAQTVMDLMNATLILNIVIIYLLILLLTFLIGKLAVNNQLELNWIKILPFGEKIYYILMKLLKMWGKSSFFFIFFIWLMLIIASVFSTYFLYVLITNFDSISEVYQNTKINLPKNS